MTNANDVRRAHDLLDELDARAKLSQEQEQLLRSFLPELPKQKTLEKICEYVDDAWFKADDPELKEWLHELHAQLKGLEVAATIAPALPAGMRLADHPVYGRVVASPGLIPDGRCQIFVLDSGTKTGVECEFVHPDTLMLIDAEPAKPARPEFLETEADYQNAPEGTIVVADGGVPCHKFQSTWSSVGFLAMKDDRGMSRARRRVLRWGK